MALTGRQGTFEQGTEDRRFDLRPVGVRRFDQQADLVAVERDHLGLLEELAIEPRQRRAQDNRKGLYAVSCGNGREACGLRGR